MYKLKRYNRCLEIEFKLNNCIRYLKNIPRAILILNELHFVLYMLMKDIKEYEKNKEEANKNYYE